MNKKTDRKHTSGLKWPLIWLIQIAAMLLIALLVAYSYWLGGLLHAILIWGVLPLTGMISAYFTTKHGLLNYAAWIAPPAAGAFGHYLVWGYLPSAGPILLCAFISLVGAAAGEVIKRQNRDGN